MQLKPVENASIPKLHEKACEYRLIVPVSLVHVCLAMCSSESALEQ